MATEDKFPTIQDLRDGLSRLVDEGLGELPVQIIIAPQSTMQAIAKVTGAPAFDPATDNAKLIEFDAVEDRLPMMMLSTDYVMSSSRTQ